MKIREFEILNHQGEIQGILIAIDKNNFEIRLDKQNTDQLDIAFLQWKTRGLIIVPPKLSKSWVEERVIPPSRQGIEEVLKDFGIEEYNLLDMLLATNGRCQLDRSYVREIFPEESVENHANR